MLTGPSQFSTAQQVCRHTDPQCGETQVHTRRVKMFVNAYAHTHTGTTEACTHTLNLLNCLEAQKYYTVLTRMEKQHHLSQPFMCSVRLYVSIVLETGQYAVS